MVIENGPTFTKKQLFWKDLCVGHGSTRCTWGKWLFWGSPVSISLWHLLQVQRNAMGARPAEVVCRRVMCTCKHKKWERKQWKSKVRKILGTVITPQRQTLGGGSVSTMPTVYSSELPMGLTQATLATVEIAPGLAFSTSDMYSEVRNAQLPREALDLLLSSKTRSFSGESYGKACLFYLVVTWKGHERHLRGKCHHVTWGNSAFYVICC